MEEIENENDYKRSKERSPSPGVKSTAAVKYTAFQSPVANARLQCNTDLNLPPNCGAAVDSYGQKQILTGETGLSSFRMGHMFPDAVGEVDVIAGAECSKKLLKLPYHPNGTPSPLHRSISVGDIPEIPPLPDLSELRCTRELQCSSMFESLRRRTNFNFTKPQPNSLITTFCQPKDDFINSSKDQTDITDSLKVENILNIPVITLTPAGDDMLKEYNVDVPLNDSIINKKT